MGNKTNQTSSDGNSATSQKQYLGVRQIPESELTETILCRDDCPQRARVAFDLKAICAILSYLSERQKLHLQQLSLWFYLHGVTQAQKSVPLHRVLFWDFSGKLGIQGEILAVYRFGKAKVFSAVDNDLTITEWYSGHYRLHNLNETEKSNHEHISRYI